MQVSDGNLVSFDARYDARHAAIVEDYFSATTLARFFTLLHLCEHLDLEPCEVSMELLRGYASAHAQCSG